MTVFVKAFTNFLYAIPSGYLATTTRTPQSRKDAATALGGAWSVTLTDLPVVPAVEFPGLARIDAPMIVDCGAIRARLVKPGRVSAPCGRAAYTYIENAIRAAQTGKLRGVVTAPIHKESLNRAGVEFPGHTEIFTALTGATRSCMMLYSDKLTVSMCTTHIG